MDYLKNYILDCRSRGYAVRTIEAYEGHVRYFLNQGYDPVKIELDDLKCFLQHLRDDRKLSLNTISKYFAALGSFYDYLDFEGLVDQNLIQKFRKRYLRNYKRLHVAQTKQLIEIPDMIRLIQSVDELRYKAMMLFLAKTGVRRNELITLDKKDISLDKKTVLLKPTPKRSNRLIFFDGETRDLLDQYLKSRLDDSPALFVGPHGRRIYRNQVYEVVTRYGQKVEIHDPLGNSHEKFTPHCFRHFFTTHLRRAGMSREYLQELRGDARSGAIDVYHHISPEELQKDYERYIPGLCL